MPADLANTHGAPPGADRQFGPLGLLAAAAAHAGLLLLPALVVDARLVLAPDAATCCFLLLATAFCLADLAGARPPRGRDGLPADGVYRRLCLATGVLLLVIFWLALGEHAAAGTPTSPACLVGGGLLMLAGCGLRLAAIRALGRHFVTEIEVAPAQPLVETGPYGALRHPSETGLLAVALGACLLLGGAGAACVWLLGLLPVVLWRLRREDRCLSAAFGQRYDDYARRVKALIPWLA